MTGNPDKPVIDKEASGEMNAGGRGGKKAVFLDRDGVLCHEVGHLHRIEDLKVIDGAGEALKTLKDLGYLLVVVTNQGGIAKGLYTEKEFWAVLRELERRLGVTFDGVYFCPHHPDGVVEELRKDCPMRKPSPGMIQKASEELNIDLKRSWMIGDHIKDIEAARRAGVWRSILVLTGYGKEMLRRIVDGEVELNGGGPHYIAQDILFAARFISLVEEKGDPIEIAERDRGEVRRRARM